MVTELNFPTHANALPRPILMPDTFGGSGKAEDFSTYMQHFRSTCDVNGYDDEQKLQLLPARLLGTAHDLFTAVLANEPHLTFSSAVRALQERLEPPQQAQMHEAALRQRHKLAHESQYDFAAELRRLARRAYPGQSGPLFDSMLLQSFIDGQPTRDLRLALASPRPENLDTAVQKAIEVQSLLAREIARDQQSHTPQVFAAAAAESEPRRQGGRTVPAHMATGNGDERDRLASVLENLDARLSKLEQQMHRSLPFSSQGEVSQSVPPPRGAMANRGRGRGGFPRGRGAQSQDLRGSYQSGWTSPRTCW